MNDNRFQKNIPVRGRKPGNIFPVVEFPTEISKKYPRKGTETFYVVEVQSETVKFQKNIPVRGRKPSLIICFAVILDLFQKNIPVRGRKLQV